MVYLPSFNDILDYVKRQQPTTISTSTPAIGGGGQASGQQSPQGATTSAFNPTYTPAPASLINPIQSGLQEQRGELQKAWETFQTQAGPSRTFESVGGAQTLGQAIETPETTPDYAQKMLQAQQLLSSQYGGPQTLEEAQTLSPIKQQATEWQQQAQALQTGPGVQTLLGKAAPQLTGGQKKFEAQQIALTPGFGAERQAALQDVNKFWEELAERETAAQAKATERTSEEKAIGQKGQEYLAGQKTSISDAWNALIAQNQAEQEATQKAWENLYNTGTLEAIQAIPQAARAEYTPPVPEGTPPWEVPAPQQWTPEQFNTQARQDLAAAQQKYQDIMTNPKYASIANIPLEGLTIDQRGQEQFTNVAPLVQARQAELEAAGFSPGRATAGATQYGKYATYMPLYYTQGGPLGSQWTPEDYRNYFQYLPGVSPTRENVSTEQQRTIYNNIETLMGEVDRIEEAGEPLRAAKIAADVGRFLEDENTALEERKEKLTAAQQTWATQVKKARKNYKKAQSGKMWGKVIRGLMGVTTMGLSEAVRALGLPQWTAALLGPAAALTGGGTLSTAGLIGSGALGIGEAIALNNLAKVPSGIGGATPGTIKV